MGSPVASSSTLPQAHRAVRRFVGCPGIHFLRLDAVEPNQERLSTFPVPLHPRTSQNCVKAKFAECVFHTLGGISSGLVCSSRVRRVCRRRADKGAPVCMSPTRRICPLLLGRSGAPL